MVEASCHTLEFPDVAKCKHPENSRTLGRFLQSPSGNLLTRWGVSSLDRKASSNWIMALGNALSLFDNILKV